MESMMCQYSDGEMLVDPGEPSSQPTASLENNDPLISEVFRLTSNGIASVEDGDTPMQFPPTPEVPPPKKSTKKRKTEKNGASTFAQTELGSSSIPSPCSSVLTSSSAAPTKPNKAHAVISQTLSSFVAAKDKERNLVYVNYLNAFANSLTVHPPLRRTGQKIAGTVTDEASVTGGLLGNVILDFENGGSRPGQTTPYLPDVDRDRCGHNDSFCPFSKRDGYSYCEKHLLDDKGLPFVPCAFQRLEANPCPYPARMPPGAGGKNRPQRSKEALCSLHMEKCLQEVKQHMSCSANAIFSTMDGLAAYNSNVDKGLPPTNTTDLLEDLAEPQTRDYLETYLRATAKDTYATGSSSEDSLVDENDVGLFRSKTFDTDDELDSAEDEPLKYAHHFSVEELTRILRSKIAKHKELLACELRLQEYKLKDARARYLTEVAEERTFLPSVHTQAKYDPESCTAYRNIRTMLRVDRKRPRFSYANARRPGVVLRHGGKLPDSVFRCQHVDTGSNGKTLKCKQFSLPFSRHCLSHILEDQYQYLYKSCAATSPTQCRNPILKNMGAKYCYHHTDHNIIRSGPDLNLNDSHTQGSSSSDMEVEPASLPMEAASTKGKRVLKRAARARDLKGVFLPRLDSDSPVTVQTEISAVDTGSPESTFPIKDEEMVIDENQP